MALKTFVDLLVAPTWSETDHAAQAGLVTMAIFPVLHLSSG